MNFLSMLKYGSIGLLLGGSFVAFPRVVHACGGTYCDGGPTTVPVTQSGENIVFVMDGANVEAHIQIQYTGDAHHFAWVIPVATVPELSVGSQALFANLLAGTVPTYSFTPTSTCSFAVDEPSGGFGCGASSDEASSGGSGGGDGPPQTGTVGVTVSDVTVGAFDVSILQGGTAKEVTAWLDANGFASTSTTPALLSSYVKKNYVFLAVRLAGENGVNEIQPLVVKYPGSMPCIPLVLTAEAAVDNMGIRAFFLGSDRVFPENFADVTLNDARIDWIQLATNYDAVVMRAVDEAPGHLGFVTEYAGASGVVQTTGLFSPSWNAAVFKTTPPEQVVDELVQQGLATCGPQKCTFSSPLLAGLLAQYLPPQAGISRAAWYATLDQRADQIDMTAWDPSGFAHDFSERIVQPGRHAVEVLEKHPYLTRVFTRISPSEMKLDPTFNLRPDLSAETVSATHSATSVTTCRGTTAMTLPDGASKVALTPQQAWPDIAGMPFASVIRTVPAKGAPVVVVDNRPAIQGQLAMRLDASGFLADQVADANDSRSSSGSSSGGCGLRPLRRSTPRGPALFAVAILALGLRRVVRRKG